MINFRYPTTGAAEHDLDMVSPILGDSETYDLNTSFHITMDGDVLSYRRKLRRTLLLTFRGVTKTQYDAFITFYLASDGLLVRYTDPSEYKWDGYIINNPLETTIVSGKDSCKLYNLTLQYSVVAVTSPVPEGYVYLVDDESNYLVDDEGNYLVATA